MHIFVGSENPVKINAVTTAIGQKLETVTIHGFDVPSGVPAQPIGDEQTREGARNRARAALQRGLAERGTSENRASQPSALGVGLEGGVYWRDGILWSTVWVAVVDVDGSLFESNGAQFALPKKISDALAAGEELGPLMEKVVGTANVRQKSGTIGVLTKNFVDRTEEYSAIAKMAIGLWYGRDWDADLY